MQIHSFQNSLIFSLSHLSFICIITSEYYKYEVTIVSTIAILMDGSSNIEGDNCAGSGETLEGNTNLLLGGDHAGLRNLHAVHLGHLPEAALNSVGTIFS